jgi:hypothetical protein
MDDEFNLDEFYWKIIQLFEDEEDWGLETLAWWNRCTNLLYHSPQHDLIISRQVFGASNPNTTAIQVAPCVPTMMDLICSSHQ